MKSALFFIQSKTFIVLQKKEATKQFDNLRFYEMKKTTFL